MKHTLEEIEQLAFLIKTQNFSQHYQFIVDKNGDEFCEFLGKASSYEPILKFFLESEEIISDLVNEVKRIAEVASFNYSLMINQLGEENKRLREALEFYSKEENYQFPYPHGTIKEFSEVARKALEGNNGLLR